MPSKRRKKPPVYGRPAFWVTVLIVAGALFLGWRMWQEAAVQSPRFHYALMEIDGETRSVLSGETLRLHPRDHVRIRKISTSVPFNKDVRLVADELDVDALRYDTLLLQQLLPDQEAFHHYHISIHIKHLNRDIGQMTWLVQPFIEDWPERANRIIDDKRRLAHLERGVQLMPNEEVLRKRLLQEYQSQKEWAKAAAMLEELAAKPGQDEGIILVALLEAYTALEDSEQMVRVLQRLVELEKHDTEDQLQLAEMLEDKGKVRESIQHYEALLERLDEADALPIYRRLGYLYTQVENTEKAIARYLEAARLDQRDPQIQYDLSYLFDLLGDQEKADFHLGNAITLNPEDVKGQMALAQRLLERGRLDEAEKNLTDVLRKEPDSLDALMVMARVMEKKGNKEGLKGVYEKLLSVKPENETLLFNLGVLDYEAGNWESAVKYLQRYVQTRPEDATAHSMLFDMYNRLDDGPMACQQALVLVDLVPQQTAIYPYLFDCLTEKKNYATMVAVMNKGLDANPGESRLRRYLVFAHLQQGHGDAGLREGMTLLQEDTEGMEALVDQVFAHFHARGEVDRVIPFLEEAVRVRPDSHRVREYLTAAYLQTGKEKEAIGQMENILEHRPQDVDLMLRTAKLKEKTGDPSGAAVLYKQILDIVPEHPEASQAYLAIRLEGLQEP